VVACGVPLASLAPCRDALWPEGVGVAAPSSANSEPPRPDTRRCCALAAECNGAPVRGLRSLGTLLAPPGPPGTLLTEPPSLAVN